MPVQKGLATAEFKKGSCRLQLDFVDLLPTFSGIYIYIRCPVPSLLFLGVVNFLDMKGLPNHEPFFS